MNEDAHFVLPIIGIPALLLLSGSIALFRKHKSLPCLLQLVGAAGLMIVVVTHIAEAFQLLPWMRWGRNDSAGHYLDLGSALVGIAVFPLGYVLHTFASQRPV